MSFQHRSAHIVRWGALALIVGTAACAGDNVTAPEAADDIQVITADAKGGKKGGGESHAVFEPQRFRQLAYYAPGSLDADGQVNPAPDHRMCSLNSYEDRDGNDHIFTAPDGVSYRKEHINESDGFVMIHQSGAGFSGTAVTYIGRSNWSAQIWFAGVDPSATTTNGNSHARGVVFPVERDVNGVVIDDDVRELLLWLDANEATLNPGSWEPGSWIYDENGALVPSPTSMKYDLLNDPLGIIPQHPDPDMVGTVGRAVDRINGLLAYYEGQGKLRGVECDVDWWGPVSAPTGIRHNDILFTDTWPKQLNRLFRGY